MLRLAIDRDQPSALHHQIADFLRDAIREGRLQPGDVLPPEPRLAAENGVARGTLRQAIQQLTREGLLQRRRGHGTFVSAPYAIDGDAPRVAGAFDALLPAFARTITEIWLALHRQETREEALVQEHERLREELHRIREQISDNLAQMRALETTLRAEMSEPRVPGE
jgi:DNA-binding GntR family transcriptional regulator